MVSVSYLIRRGFLRGLQDCIGKTISKAYVIEMEWGPAWVAQFTDGTRVLLPGRFVSDDYAINPVLSDARPISSFTAREIKEMKADMKRRFQQARERARARKLEQLEYLKKELEIK